MRWVRRVAPGLVRLLAPAGLAVLLLGAAEPEAKPDAEAKPEAEQTAPATPAAPSVQAPPPTAERLGDDACLECHETFAAGWETERHNRYMRSANTPEELRGCEGCHGPGSAHLEDPDFRSIRNPNRETGLAAVKPCLSCHQADIVSTHWLSTSHAQAGMHCGSCHDVHNRTRQPHMLRKSDTELCLSCHPRQGPEFRLNSHHPVLEGRMNCSDCHNPHEDREGWGELLKQGNDQCVRCHMEKRGPFVFEHQTSVEEGDEQCITCHRAHGSPNPKLQEYFGRGACLQCHVDIAFDPPHQARPQNCWSAGCHNRIHGSNNNRLFIF